MRKLILILSISLFAISGNLLAQQDSIWTLEKCIEHAFNQNIQVRKSELSNQRFSLYAEQAKAQRLPSVNASASQNFDWSKSSSTSTSGFSGSNGSNISVNSGVTIYNASRISNQIIRINFNDILYIEGLKDYVKVYTSVAPKPILSLTSLKLLETKLPDSKFMRVHRSFIVNLEKIDTIERSRIVFGKEYIPVSDQYKDKFQEYLDKNFL